MRNISLEFLALYPVENYSKGFPVIFVSICSKPSTRRYSLKCDEIEVILLISLSKASYLIISYLHVLNNVTPNTKPNKLLLMHLLLVLGRNWFKWDS